MYDFVVFRRFSIFVVTNNLSCVAGNWRWFSQRGPLFHTFVKLNGDWAMEREWNFILFKIFHISEGKSTYIPGWHVRFSKLIFQKEYGGFSIRYKRADTGDIRPPIEYSKFRG